MSAENVLQLTGMFGIIPALFIWLLLYVMKEHKLDKENTTKREESLMLHIEKSDTALTAITLSIERISTSQQSLQSNVALMQRDIEQLKNI